MKPGVAAPTGRWWNGASHEPVDALGGASLTEAGPHQGGDLARVGVTALFLLAEDQIVVQADFEHASIGGVQAERLDVGLELFEQFIRQTDGARGVVSNGAVFHGDGEHSGLFSAVRRRA